MDTTYRQRYEAYLLGEHWAILRRGAIDRAGRRCEACGARKALVGHHLIYRAPLESCALDDIMCLCAGCHGRWHKQLEESGERLCDKSRADTAFFLRGGTTKPLESKVAPKRTRMANGKKPSRCNASFEKRMSGDGLKYTFERNIRRARKTMKLQWYCAKVHRICMANGLTEDCSKKATRLIEKRWLKMDRKSNKKAHAENIVRLLR